MIDLSKSTEIALPGLANGNILAVRLSYLEKSTSDFFPILAVQRAFSNPDNSLTYVGNCLLFVIGDQQIAWLKMISLYENKPVSLGQLARIPQPAYYRQIRMQPYPDFAPDPYMEVPNIFITSIDWDVNWQYSLTISDNTCQLFRRLTQ